MLILLKSKSGLAPVFPWLVVLLFLINSSPSVQAQHNGQDWPVKVLIVSHTRSLNLTIKQPAQVRTFYTNKTLGRIESIPSLRVMPTQAGLVLGGQEYRIFGVYLAPGNDRQVNFSLNNLSYRGQINLIREPDLTLSVINHLPLEEYLAGVLPREVPPDWPEAALKAQAIAARTYAFYQALQNQDKDFHLQADVRSQVYGGADREAKQTTAAVKATKGQVLTYQGYLFPTYYHAACGGQRQDAGTLWGLKIKPLRGGACGFCLSSPHQMWQVDMDPFQIREKLSVNSQHLGQIYAINIAGRDRSGRVKHIRISHSEDTLLIPADKFRLDLGADVVKSTNFDITQNKDKFIFTGHGWGHGVGLCQWGAAEMARKGYSAEQILQYYYPGSRIANITDYIAQ